VDARPVLSVLARVLEECGLEAILIGNAAAAVQGAPVTTLDLDFLFRKNPRNLAKLKSVAKALGAVILRPYYPASDLFRLVRDDDGLQVDFMSAIHGVRSFESLRSRAWRLKLDGSAILVADLADVVRSKRAAGRPRDRAVLEILERTLDEKTKADAATKTRRPPARK
jgi:predicted nucleotidyltransferase